DLSADIAQRALGRHARIGPEYARKDRGADGTKVNAGRADVLEADGRQVPLGDRLRKAMRGDLVDLEAGEGVDVAVALRLLVVEVVVLEAAEVIGRQRVQPVAAGQACRRVEPERRMLPPDREAEIEAGIGVREELAVGLIRAPGQFPAVALLMI